MKIILVLLLITVASAHDSECTTKNAIAIKQCFSRWENISNYYMNFSNTVFKNNINNMNEDKVVKVIDVFCDLFRNLSSCFAPVIGGCNNIEGYQKYLM